MLKKYKLNDHNAVIILIIILFSMLIVTAGGLLNYKVVVSNNCKMPVLDKGNIFIDESEHFLYTNYSSVKYSILSDMFYVKDFSGVRYIFSLGDLIMIGGIVLCFIIFIMSLVGKYKIYERGSNEKLMA